MSEIKIGILGCSYMGRMHAECYRATEGVRIAAVADTSREAATALGEKHGAKIYTDAKRLIEECELDAIDICLPTFLHKEYALLAMGKVKYVFIEKPLALNMQECGELIEAQRKYGTCVQVGQVIRFWDEYVYLRELIESGRLGRVVNASFKRISPSPVWSAGGWLTDAKLSGGAIVDMHIHDIDYMLQVFGEPKKTSSVKNTLGEKNSYIATVCDYGDFAVSVEGTWFLPPSYPFNMYYRVAFERGAAEYDRGVLTVYTEDGAHRPDLAKSGATLGGTGGNIAEVSGYVNELRYFTDRIRLGAPIEEATLESAARSLAFVLDELKGCEKIQKNGEEL